MSAAPGFHGGNSAAQAETASSWLGIVDHDADLGACDQTWFQMIEGSRWFQDRTEGIPQLQAEKKAQWL